MENLEFKDVISLGLGGLGFLIASITFFLTQLRPPKIVIEVGPEVTVYHPRDGGFGMYFPISFINNTKRGGSISRVAAILSLTTDTENAYFFRWADFVEYDANTKGYRHLDNARPFSVPGETVVSKFIWFVWRPDSQPSLTLSQGIYQVEFLIWERASGQPSMTSTHSFEVSEQIAARLLERRESGSPRTEIFPIDGYRPENLVLAEKERRRLRWN